MTAPEPPAFDTDEPGVFVHDFACTHNPCRCTDAEAAPFLDIVFDGPPGPESGRFVEVEDHAGRSVAAGEWINRGDGMWALRIPSAPQSGAPTGRSYDQLTEQEGGPPNERLSLYASSAWKCTDECCATTDQ